MAITSLPKIAKDVLSIPGDRIPDVVHALLRARQMSPLLARIHADLASGDDGLRQQGVLALRRLGFPD